MTDPWIPLWRKIAAELVHVNAEFDAHFHPNGDTPMTPEQDRSAQDTMRIWRRDAANRPDDDPDFPRNPCRICQPWAAGDEDGLCDACQSAQGATNTTGDPMSTTTCTRCNQPATVLTDAGPLCATCYLADMDEAAGRYMTQCKNDLLAKLHADGECDPRACPHCAPADDTVCALCGSPNRVALVEFAYHGNRWRKHVCAACVRVHREDTAAGVERPTITELFSDRTPERSPITTLALGAMAIASLAIALFSSSVMARESFTIDPPSGAFPAYELPFIGTPAYSDSCSIVAAWEDHSARAYCAEDGSSYVYVPRDQRIPLHGISFLKRAAGWHAQEGAR